MANSLFISVVFITSLFLFMLHERSQSQRPCITLFHLYEMYKTSKSGQKESRLVVVLGYRGRKRDWGGMGSDC